MIKWNESIKKKDQTEINQRIRNYSSFDSPLRNHFTCSFRCKRLHIRIFNGLRRFSRRSVFRRTE